MKKALASIAALALAAGAANADLVTNGGFETGDLTGWTVFGDDTYIGVWDEQSQEGDFNAYFGPLETAGITQVLTAPAGSQIEVSFYIRSEAEGTPNSLLAQLDGQTIANVVDFTTFEWTHYTGTITTADANPTLSFTFTNPSDYTDMDNVTASLVPAPGAMALLGLGGLVAARRRRN
jgi:MYXO-CTERM domain-containing protein